MDNYYVVLGVTPTANLEDIKTAYRQQIKRLHPDLNQQLTSHQRASQLNQAFATLSQPQQRLNYDQRFMVPEANAATAWSSRTLLLTTLLWSLGLALAGWFASQQVFIPLQFF